MRQALYDATSRFQRQKEVRTIDFLQDDQGVSPLLRDLRRMQQEEKGILENGMFYSAVALAECISQVWERMEYEEEKTLEEVLLEEKVPSACEFSTVLKDGLDRALDLQNRASHQNKEAKAKILEIFDNTEEMRRILHVSDEVFSSLYGSENVQDSTEEFTKLSPLEKRKKKAIAKRKVEIRSRKKLTSETEQFRRNMRKNFGSFDNLMTA